jgi:hypothetical protein
MRFQNIVQGNYLLGILFALGRYVDRTRTGGEGYFLLCHERMHFLWTLQSALGLKSSIYTVTRRGEEQYRLKVTGLDTEELIQLGWSFMDGATCLYPNIVSGHRHFIRAYTEIRSELFSVPSRDRKGRKVSRPGLRLHGNTVLLGWLLRYLPLSSTRTPRELPAGEGNRETASCGVLELHEERELQNLVQYLYREPVRYSDPRFRDAVSEVIEHGELPGGRR